MVWWWPFWHRWIWTVLWWCGLSNLSCCFVCHGCALCGGDGGGGCACVNHFPNDSFHFDGTIIHLQNFDKEFSLQSLIHQQTNQRKLISTLKSKYTLVKMYVKKNQIFTRNHCINLCSLLKYKHGKLLCHTLHVYIKPHVLKLLVDSSFEMQMMMMVVLPFHCKQKIQNRERNLLHTHFSLSRRAYVSITNKTLHLITSWNWINWQRLPQI